MKVSFIKTYWKHIVFIFLVANIAISMACYKVSITPQRSVSYIYLMIVLELGLAITLFSQALLRENDEFAANEAFMYSKWLRFSVGIIGLIIFLEHATVIFKSPGKGNPDWIFKIIASEEFRWSHLFTYELANMAALLIEWMFSRLLQYKAVDYKAESERLEEKVLGLDKRIEELSNYESAFSFIREMIKTEEQPLVSEIPTMLNGEVAKLKGLIKFANIGQSLSNVAIRVNPSTRLVFCDSCGESTAIGQKVKDNKATCSNCSSEIEFINTKELGK